MGQIRRYDGNARTPAILAGAPAYLDAMFQVLRSSAGAGKTHALVKHYLGHCLRSGNTMAYKQVLALTFTSKAANEMKERVAGYLEQLARNDLANASVRDVMQHLVEMTGSDEPVIAARAKEVLDHMLNHWSDVAISTIDAFTRKVVRPFARDLRLDHDLRMTTDHDWYLDRAVEDVIEEAGTSPGVTALLSESCRVLLDEEAAWDPERSLRDLGKELDMERSIVPLRLLDGTDAEEVLRIMARMRDRNREVAKELRRKGQDALDLLARSGLSSDDLSNTSRGFYRFLMLLAGFGDAPVHLNSYTEQSLEKDIWWSGKASAAAKSIVSDLAPELRQRILDAAEILEREQRHYFVRKSILNQLPTTFTLHELHRCLEERKASDGVVYFSDLTRRVAELVQDEPVPFIYERIGERYRHFLIDEFQDTSLLQWTTLLPLIHNALGSGGTALLVGDAKQAIYRWRNGEVRLFLALPRLFARGERDVDVERERALESHHREVQPLLTNYRSSATVVRFNNALFTEACSVLSPELRRVYDGHEQLASNAREGLVHLERFSKELTGAEAARARSAFTLERVEEAIADGFSAGDIAVLVRTGEAGREAAEALAQAGHPVISPEGLRLAGDPLVESVLELLRVLVNGTPEAVLRARQQMARLNSETGALEVDPFGPSMDVDGMRAEIQAWMEDHGIAGPRSTLTDLIGRLIEALGTSPASDARALALLDEAHAFASEHGPDPEGFIAHWDRTGNRRSLSPPDDGASIQVMTVHKAKGLEFPVVIIPSARMASAGRKGERLWIAPREAVSELPFALVNDSSELRELGVAESEEEHQLSILDSLDLLYVAFTRAAQRLYASVPERGADEVTKAVLRHMDAHGDGERLIIGERGRPWSESTGMKSERFGSTGLSTEQALVALRFEAPDTWDPGDPDPLRRHGNLMHELFSRVKRVEDLSPAIAALQARGSITPVDAAALKERLEPLIVAPALAPWFSPASEVHNEAAIITASGHVQRPDRVVIDQGTARVLDLKSGVPLAAHHDQVRSYMHLLRELGYERVEGALLYLASGNLETVSP